ncbi:ABC transporter substrate-binding protein [Inquilinus sp.]|uniref:ABC transporter substrate-binding protein n=1 Tax=Inquilinus sp. TaxID=1932117 RepID=UPI0031D7390B
MGRWRNGLLALAVALAPAWGGGAEAKTPVDQLVIGASLAQVLSLDPGQATESGSWIITSNIYDRLVSTDPNDATKLVPQLAESWDIDGKSITFHLRDAKFASGNPVTAEDAAWSLRRMMKLNQAAASLWKPYGYDEKNIDDFLQVVDPKTFRLGLPEGTIAEFVLFALSGNNGAVIDKTEATKHEANNDFGNAWLRANSAGSGPFVLKRWSPNEIILMDRNDAFWGGAPAMKRVVLRHVAESQVQRLLLERGDIDVATALAASDIAAFDGKAGFVTQRVPTGGFYVLAMNTQNQYLANPDVRRAIAWGLDYAGMQKTIMGPYGRVRQVPVPENYPTALPDPGYTLDVAKAKELLAKAGFPDGFPLVLKTIAETPRVDLATAIQASLAQIGIKVSIEQGNGSQIIAAHRAREFDLLMPLTGGGNMADPIGSLQNFTYNPDNSPNGNSGYFTWRSAWDIPELTKLTVQARGEPDRAKREALYTEIQKQFLASGPAILPMFERFSPVVVSANVENFVGQGFRGVRLDSVKKKAE